MDLQDVDINLLPYWCVLDYDGIYSCHQDQGVAYGDALNFLAPYEIVQAWYLDGKPTIMRCTQAVYDAVEACDKDIKFEVFGYDTECFVDVVPYSLHQLNESNK